VAVILQPSSGEDLMINWWNWRPIVALLVQTGILPAGEREERCSANGCGGCLSGDEARRAAEFLEKVIADMRPGERLLRDGNTTSRPKDFALPVSEWDDEETQNRYAVDCSVLKQFMEFCRGSGGFEIL
jgi:hypothetical protein